jgi:Flp pilus assembly protein TadD
MSPAKGKAFSAAPASQRGDDVASMFAAALAYHQLGLRAEAEVGYRKVLKKTPNHFHALHLLGMFELQNGSSETAVRLLKRALLVDPRSSVVHCDLSSVRQSGRDQSAICRRIEQQGQRPA